MKIAIIVLHYGDDTQAIKCIDSLKQQSYIEHVIISNNNPHPLNQEILARKKPVTILNNKENNGYAAGMNEGIRFALTLDCEYILLTTNDTVFPPNSINQFVEEAKKKNLDLATPLIKDEKGDVWFAGGEIDKVRFTAGHKTGKTDYLSGCCMLIRREVFNSIGLLNERYFLYYEDVDFCIRARTKGYKLGVIDTVAISHDTSKSTATKKNMRYYLARNHLLILWSFGSFKAKLREMVLSPYYLLEHAVQRDTDSLLGYIHGLICKTGKRT